MFERNVPVEMPINDVMVLAVGFHKNGQLDQAEKVYRAVLKARPDHEDALHFLGILCHQRGDDDTAIALIRRVLARAPKHVGAHNNLGNILTSQGDLDGAITAYRRAVELQPNHDEAVRNMGVALKRKGRLEDAADAFRQALKLNPRDLDSYRRLGAILASLDRRDEARDVYLKWLEIDPDSPVARHMLAACSEQDVPVRASDSFVERTFDTFADSFDEVLATLEYKAPLLVAQAVRTALGSPQGRLDILDAGCGTGLCGPDLKPYGRRLVGVDLSKKMLEKAAARGVYDDLVAAEIGAHVSATPAAYDLIVSADTLVYFGDLQGVLTAASLALRPGGHIIFTVERADPTKPDDEVPDGFRLNPHGRYSHTEAYVRLQLGAAGFVVDAISDEKLRIERLRPVKGLLARAHKPGV